MDSPSVSSDTNTPNRKRPRENETPSQRLKREKAAERQRRKRERDRNAANMGIMSYPGPPPDQQQQQHQQQQPPAVQSISHQVGSASQGPSTPFAGQELSQEEVARRERVRAAARERQRKHRQLVKQRKMRELGLDMGNEMMSGMEEYRVPPPDGHFHQVMAHDLQPHPPPMGHDQSPPYPQAQQLSGGRLFASTLLLSFSCDPLLKGHLMRTLHMSHEELASLEPVIGDAWEHWDHQRRMHYEKQAAVSAPDGSAGVPGGAPNGPHPYPPPPPANGDPSINEFRSRFRSSIEVPPPFATYPPNSRVDPAISTATAGSSGPASVASSDPIDPHLTGQPSTSSDGAKATPNDMGSKATMSNSIDPNLAQGKNET